MGSKSWSFSTYKSFVADASDTGLVIFNSKKVPDGISVLCHDDKFGNGVNSLVSVLIMTIYIRLPGYT